MNNYIPWATPHFWGNEKKYVANSLDSGWISSGHYVDQLEEKFAEYCNIPFAIVTSSATTANHMAYLALGIGPGDEVIVPGFGFLALSNIALHVGAKPIFADVDKKSWCVTAEKIKPLITKKTKAIAVIHTYGNVCDMDPIIALAKTNNLILIEDAAQSIGSKYKGRYSGTMGEVGIFSFQATKTITTGEGGAVVTNNSSLRDQMKLFRSHGMGEKKYWHKVAGHNFRITNMQAAIGCAQLEQIDKITIERSRVYKTYCEFLNKIDGVDMQNFSSDVDPMVWAVGLRLDSNYFPQGRDKIILQLKDKGIESRPGFYSADTMPHLYGKLKLPVARELSDSLISLPSSPILENEQIEFICNTLDSLRK